MSSYDSSYAQSEEERRAARQESLPGLFFGIFVLVTVIGLVVLFLATR